MHEKDSVIKTNWMNEWMDKWKERAICLLLRILQWNACLKQVQTSFKCCLSITQSHLHTERETHTHEKRAIMLLFYSWEKLERRHRPRLFDCFIYLYFDLSIAYRWYARLVSLSLRIPSIILLSTYTKSFLENFNTYRWNFLCFFFYMTQLYFFPIMRKSVQQMWSHVPLLQTYVMFFFSKQFNITLCFEHVILMLLLLVQIVCVCVFFCRCCSKQTY